MALTNKQIVERVNDAFARGDVESFLSYCDDNVVWTMVGAESVRGKDAIRKWMGSAPPEPPKFSVDTVVAEGDHVTAIGNMTMKEEGKVVPYSYCDVWTFKNGAIVELRAFVIKTKA
jgi:ketosteroid isomerase-like protein